MLDTKISDSGLIEEVDDTITPRTQATKQQLDNKLRLAESVNKYETIVSQLERDILNQVCLLERIRSAALVSSSLIHKSNMRSVGLHIIYGTTKRSHIAYYTM